MPAFYKAEKRRENMAESLVRLRVNGRDRQVVGPDSMTLLEALREGVHLHGTKEGCGVGHCGTCTVWIDGQPRLSCLTLARTVAGREVLTVEGLGGWHGRHSGDGAAEMHPLQETMVEEGGVQCGFCTPGMVMAGAALLRDTPHPTAGEIKEALSGHLCRCTGYAQIVRSVEVAAKRMEEGGGDEA